MASKKLYRSREDKIIFGVCGGLAEYFNVDPLIVRLIFIILAIWGGSGVLIYFIIAIFAPEKSVTKSTEKAEKNLEETISKNIEQMSKEVESKIKGFESAIEGLDDEKKRETSYTRIFLGITLLFVGIFLLAGNLFPFFDIMRFWPLILIIVALMILLRSDKEKK